MKVKKLKETYRGWFIGDFENAIYRTKDTEVAVKHDKAGDKYEWHYHKKATEVTVVVKGHLRFNDQDFYEGDILLIEPGEGSDCTAIEDTISVVIKLPSVMDDKFFD